MKWRLLYLFLGFFIGLFPSLYYAEQYSNLIIDTYEKGMLSIQLISYNQGWQVGADDTSRKDLNTVLHALEEKTWMRELYLDCEKRVRRHK